MIEKAKVIKINNNIATLACPDSENCGSCSAHGICGGAKDRKFNALKPDRMELSDGDTVEILLPTGKTIGAAFMVMIFPLALFIIFFFLTGKIIENSTEGVKVLGGLIGLAAGFIVNLLLNKNPGKSTLPRIIKKV